MPAQNSCPSGIARDLSSREDSQKSPRYAAVTQTPVAPVTVSSSTSSTSDNYPFPTRDLRERLGPTAISPRPISAHPLRRPDLYGKQYKTLELECIEEGVIGPCDSNTSQSAALEDETQKMYSTPVYSEPCFTRTMYDQGSPYQSPYPSREEIPGYYEVDVEAPANDREVSFVVSLSCGDNNSPMKVEEGMSVTSISPASSTSTDFTLAKRTSSHFQATSESQGPASSPQDIIERTRRQSSIVKHTDSLDLIEHAVTEPPYPLTSQKSIEMIERTRRESSIVHHVDSLTLIEQSKPELVEEAHHKVKDNCFVCNLVSEKGVYSEAHKVVIIRNHARTPFSA